MDSTNKRKSLKDKSESPPGGSQVYLPNAPNGKNYDSNVLKIAKMKSNTLASKMRGNNRNLNFKTEEIQKTRVSNDQVIMNSIMKRNRSRNSKSPENHSLE